MIHEVIETLEKLSELHKKKNADYTGASNNPFFNFDVAEDMVSLFTRDRDKVFACMIGIKVGRIAALINSGNTPNHESLLDSFDDMILYSTIWKADILRALKQHPVHICNYCGQLINTIDRYESIAQGKNLYFFCDEKHAQMWKLAKELENPVSNS